MSHIKFPRMRRIILVLPLLLLLAFFLVGCGGNSATNASGNSASQTTTTQSGSSGSDATSVQSGDQQAQNLLQSLDKAQQDADSATNSGDQQDTSQTP